MIRSHLSLPDEYGRATQSHQGNLEASRCTACILTETDGHPQQSIEEIKATVAYILQLRRAGD